MKVSDADILMVPGADGAPPAHWMSRWQERLKTARRVDPPVSLALDDWTTALVMAVSRRTRPAVLVAQGLGVIAIAHAAPLLRGGVAGAFLVGPSGSAAVAAAADPAFSPVPRDPLPFPALLVASRTDPGGSHSEADDLAHAWGAAFVDAGEAGGLDTDSGHGPWPEGLTRFATLMTRIKAY